MVIIGLFRKPLDFVYMHDVAIKVMDKNTKWGFMDPKSFNYFIGSNAKILIIREDGETYQISVKRYLNILPDSISQAVYVGKTTFPK